MFPNKGEAEESFDLGKEEIKDVIKGDKESLTEGELINSAINLGVGFNPDLMYEQLVKNYSMAKKLFGERIIKELTTYDPRYVEKNIHIPEFKKELKGKIDEGVENLKDKGLVNNDNSLSEKGLELASLVLYVEELDKMVSSDYFGEKFHKKRFIYGDKGEVKDYRKKDRYKDIAIKKSVKMAARRQHSNLIVEDLKSFERQSKGKINLVYALDASGSMKGKKLDMCKKAGVALAYKAIEEKDKVGLIVFGSDIREEERPSNDFVGLLKKITRVRAAKETDIAKTIDKAIELFPREGGKHLILISDALPTKGEKPKEETLEAVSRARGNNISVSLIGIQLDKEGKELAEKIVGIGEGNLFIVKNLENLDKVVLEDYYSVI